MNRQLRTAAGGFGRSHMDDYDVDRDASEGSDIDIDFSVTESGRTVAHLVSQMMGDEDDMDFALSHTERSVQNMVSHVPDGRGHIDYSVISNGRTVEELTWGDAAGKPPGPYARQRSAAKAIPAPNPTSAASNSYLSLSLPSSHGSTGSAFISGILNPAGGNGLLSHTPPTFFGTSYEAQHFGKRQRSGSVSGRLRSASDLEDKGLIDRRQKGILKDLIISGDEALQSALDEYEQGDTSTLENMIRSGELLNRASADIDLLGELDLDFLTVDDQLGDAISIGPAVLPPIMHSSSESRSMPIPMQPPPSFPTRAQVNSMTSPNNEASPNMVSPSAHDDDGIGELDFNGEFTGDDYLQIVNQSDGHQKQETNSFEATEHRFRSNSLAFGALLNENAGPADVQIMYGRWMDQDFSHSRSGPLAPVVDSSYHVDSECTGQSGIGASLAQYGKSKSDPYLKTKAQLADDKRREKLERKEQKEKEKAEKKEKREQELRDKKEREAREKLDKKEKKAAASKAKQEKKEKDDDEERKETPSGLGRPRSMSDPNLTTSVDANGLITVDRPDGWVGAYSPESRKLRIDRFLSKRDHRVWTKKVKYDVRKNFADSRLRVKGRFVKKEDELLMRDLMSLT